MPALFSRFVAIACALIATRADAQLQTPEGAAVYAEHCAACHDQVDARIPTRASLAQMSAARILRTLDFGLMMSIAYTMKRDEREAVAAFLVGTVSFDRIHTVNCRTIESLSPSPGAADSLESLLALDHEARRRAGEFLKGLAR